LKYEFLRYGLHHYAASGVAGKVAASPATANTNGVVGVAFYPINYTTDDSLLSNSGQKGIGMPSPQHDRLVTEAIAEMRRQNMTQISACLSNYSQPAAIGGYIPDATGFYNGYPVIVEAETADGLNDGHTEAQIRAFHRSAVQRSGTLILAVNFANRREAQTLLQQTLGTLNNTLVWSF
jgi:hypothetical protein